MFNLLPKTEKEAIRREYRMRLAIVTLWLMFATFVIASTVLISSFFLSSQKEKAAMQRSDILSTSVKQERTEVVDSVLLDAQSRLALLSHEAPKVFLHDVFLKTASLKNDKISLEEVSLSRGDDGAWRVDIHGTAKDRSALLSYTQALEHSGVFRKVEVPISDFAKNSDISFSVNATGTW